PPTPTSTATPTPTLVPSATPTATPATTPCNYVFTFSSGTIVPGTDDTGNHTDDGTTFISLPFNVQIYDQTFISARVSSNGNLQFNSLNNSLSNVCLPTTTMNWAIFPHWDDLRTDQVGSGCSAYPGGVCGVFTSTSGSTPNRIFNIEWRTVYFGPNTSRANFEVRLFESDNHFELVYGEIAGTGSSATVGVQRDTGSLFAQYECNTAGSLTPGFRLIANQVCNPTP